MALSSELISELVKVTNDREANRDTNKVVYGTVVDDGNNKYVRIDGSNELTPVLTTTELLANERVAVSIENHTALVTGSTTNPSIGVKQAGDLKTSIEQTASEIKLVAQRAEEAISSISMTADQIRSEVNSSIQGVNSNITQTANQIRSEITDAVNGLNSSIAQQAGQIESVVKKQEEYTKFQQTYEGFLFEDEDGAVKIDGGSIILSGTITWSDFLDDVNESAQNAADSAESAVGSAKLAVNSADSAASSANSAYSYADAAASSAGIASSSATEAASSASKALADANSVSTALSAVNSIYSDIQNNLPSYLTGTTITNTTLMSPVIIGSKIYAVGKDTWVEIVSNGLKIYTENVDKPKFLISYNPTIEQIDMILGAGDQYGYNRLYITKTKTSGQIVYWSGEKKTAGFNFNSDGTVEVIGTLVT